MVWNLVDTMACLSGFGGWGIHIRNGDILMSDFHIDQILNQESLDWLEDKYPGVAASLRKDLAGGRTPSEIFNHVRRGHGREALAVRIRQAAIAIISE